MPSVSDATISLSYYDDAEDSYDYANNTEYMDAANGSSISSGNNNGLYDNTNTNTTIPFDSRLMTAGAGFGAGRNDSDEYSFLR